MEPRRARISRCLNPCNYLLSLFADSGVFWSLVAHDAAFIAAAITVFAITVFAIAFVVCG